QRLVVDLLTPVLQPAGKPRDEYFTTQALTRLAPFDEKLTMSRLEGLDNNASRARVLTALGLVDDALEAAARVKDPIMRAYTTVHIATAAGEQARKRQILGEALVQARGIEDPAPRVMVIGM